MTESDWLSCIDPEQMLNELRARNVSDRKLWCFTSAYSHHVWPEITDARFRRVVELGDLFVEGKAREEEVIGALGVAEGLYDRIIAEVLGNRSGLPFTPGKWGTQMAVLFSRARVRERRYQCDLFREVCDNPFRPIEIDSTWLRWSDGCVVQLAQAMYEEHRFDQMLVLEDALIDAGCDQPDVLAHCRLAREHVRGCWVVDLLLGKS